MKCILNKLCLIITGAILALLILNVNAQSDNDLQTLEITYNKTTSVVFPAVIKSVDRGSRDILAQKAKGVENILQLKAARDGFPQTNLTVITADGNIHLFTVNYSKEPNQQLLTCKSIPDSSGSGVRPACPGSNEGRDEGLIFQADMTETEMESYASQIVNRKRSIRLLNESNYKIGLSLHGIYCKDNVIFYHVKVSNRSNIDYDVDLLHFYIQDKQKVKRTASQEVAVKPLYVFGNAEKIKGQSTEEVIYALEKFTIPDAKRLMIEMFEKNGGRNISLSIKNKTIVNAKLVE